MQIPLSRGSMKVKVVSKTTLIIKAVQAPTGAEFYTKLTLTLESLTLEYGTSNGTCTDANVTALAAKNTTDQIEHPQNTQKAFPNSKAAQALTGAEF